MVGPTGSSPLRFVGEWKDIGDLMASPLKAPFYAVYSHEADEGVIRTFDLKRSPGFDIWGWGYPATEKHQREFTAAPPNNGYIEIWNGTSHSFKDEGLVTIKAGETWTWREALRPVSELLKKGDLRKQIADLVAE